MVIESKKSEFYELEIKSIWIRTNILLLMIYLARILADTIIQEFKFPITGNIDITYPLILNFSFLLIYLFMIVFRKKEPFLIPLKKGIVIKRS